MGKRTKIIISVTDILLCAFIIVGTAVFLGGWAIYMRVALYVAAAASLIVCALSIILKKDSLFKSAFILTALIAVLLGGVIAMNEVWRLDEYDTTKEKIDVLVESIRNTGGWSMLVFVIIQVFQVIILPLPAVVCYVPGSLIFGPLLATVLASVGVIAGSVISYFIGRIFGKKVVDWIAGKDVTDKYAAYMGKRGRVIFVIMQILPFFPDDLLCMVAGLSGIGFPFFLISIVIVRPAIIAIYCFFGSGTIIPFSGWGIAVWIVIIAVCVVLCVVSFKYQDRIEKWILKKFKKKKNEEETPDCKTDK